MVGSPARVSSVEIVDLAARAARVIVPDYQLSLAIGKEGQNARLAARLTGWRVDIKSETQLADEERYQSDEWAQGQWIENPETGEMEWHDAEGGEAVSAGDWQEGTATDETLPTVIETGTPEVGEAEVLAEAAVDESAPEVAADEG